MIIQSHSNLPSCFRKGKIKPLQILENDDSMNFVHLFTSMGDQSGNVDADIASDFICRMYGEMKTSDVDEARYNKLMEMTGGVDKVRKIHI